MRYSIKWRFLLKLGLILLVAAVAIHFTHRRQVSRQVGAFLYQADLARDAAVQADESHDTAKAAAEREREQTLLRRYILARPNDMDARDRLGRLMCRSVKTGRQAQEAFFVLEDILRRDPSRDDLRRFAIDYDMQLRSFKEAQGHIFFLMEKRQGNGELEGLLARCLVAERKFGEADEHYEASIKTLIPPGEEKPAPGLIESYYGQGFVRQQMKKPRSEKNGTDFPIVRMLWANEKNARAYLLATNYMREFGIGELKPIDASVPPFTPDNPFTPEGLIAAALQRAPNDLDALVTAADMARARGRRLARDPKTAAEAPKATQEARDLLARAKKEHEGSPRPYLALASLEAEERQVSEAIKVVRQGLEKLPDSVQLTLGLLKYQFRDGDAAGAADTLGKLRDRGLAQDEVDYNEARVLILKDSWQDAAPLLERAAGEMQLRNKPGPAREANLLLGRCYEQMGENQRRFEAFTRALPLEITDPLWGRAMVGIAESEVALGRRDDALKTYRKMTDWVPSAWISVARLELTQALLSPAGKQDWSRVEDALDRVAKFASDEKMARYIPDSSEPGRLRATLEHFKGKPEEARKILEALRAQRPKDVAVRVEVAMQALRENKFPEAHAILDTAAKELGDSPELRLARANTWVAAKEADLPAKLNSLTNVDNYSVAQKRQLLRGLAELATQAGSDEAASKFWNKLAEAKPFDLRAQMALFDRAVHSSDIGAMRTIVGKIGDIDGLEGPSTRLARAVLLIHESQAKNDRSLRDNALRILEGLEREQGASTSGRTYLAQALIHDLNGDIERAQPKYSQAIAHGERNPQTITRQFNILVAQNKIEDANALIDKLQNSSNLEHNLLRRIAEVALRAGNDKRALEFAKRAVPDEPSSSKDSYKDQLWLGGIYASVKDPAIQKLAEAQFRKATDLAPDSMDAWLALMQYLVANGRKAEATKIFEQSQEKVKKTDQALFRAVGNARIGESEKAVKAFQQARTEQPTEFRIVLAEADYLLQLGRLREAREGFERVLALPSGSPEEKKYARQRYAMAFAADPEAGVSREALKLIGDAPAGNESPAQARARAVILALQKDRASKLEAIRLLEVNKEGRTPGEQFMLAQLHNQVGNHQQVPVVMADLLKTEKNQIPLYVRFLAGWEIRAKFLTDAEEHVKLLVKIDPDSLGTAELKARLAMAKKDIAAARAALVPKADAPDAPLGLIARICEDIGLYDDAERLFKKYVDQNKQMHPTAVLATATYYGRRGQTAAGLQICEDVRDRLPPASVGQAAVDILYNSPAPTKADIAKVAGWLDQAATKAEKAERATLFQALAAVRNLEGDYPAAIQLYKSILADNPRDVLALNNLGYLLSASGKDHEAGRGLIERAKQLRGDHPTLLDTEALIRLQMNQPELALKLLEVVVAEAPSGPGWFHLAQAERALKHELEAKRAWGRGLELGLKVGDLHPLERKAFEDFKTAFGDQ